MAVAKQIKVFSNFKKKSSKSPTTKNQVRNIANEYERIGDQKNPDINHKLSPENIVLKSFNDKEYDYYIKNTDYSLNGKNSKYEDIYSTTPTIQATNFVNLGGINLTFLASKDEWVNFYKDLSNFVKDFMGEDYRVLSEVIQFDEFTPHLQMLGIYRSEVSNEILSQKEIATNDKLFESISRKQFTRHNNKLKDTDEYIDPKNKKDYKVAKEKWIEENREEIIKNYKPRNKTTEKKYAFIRENTIAAKKNSYIIYQNKLYEFCKEHKFIKDLCKKATKIRGEEVSFVKNSTEPVYDGKSKDHYEIKETIERENSVIEQKIANKEELTENEMYRYIRKKNREELKKEFLEYDILSWKEQFLKPIEPKFDFNLKLVNDYIKNAKEIAYKPYMEVESKIKEINLKKDNLEKEVKNILDKKNKFTESKLWYNIDSVSRIDEMKEVKRKSNIPFTEDYKKEVVILDKEDYGILLTMAKDQSTQLTAWKKHSKKLEKELGEETRNNQSYIDNIKELKGIIKSKDNEINELKKENKILKKSLETIKAVYYYIKKSLGKLKYNNKRIDEFIETVKEIHENTEANTWNNERTDQLNELEESMGLREKETKQEEKSYEDSRSKGKSR